MTSERSLTALSHSPFFSGLDAAERAELAGEAKLVEFGPGAEVFEPGQSPSALYLVVDGLAEICRRESAEAELAPVAYVGPGGILGESKIITGTPFRSLARFPEGGATLSWQRPELLRRLQSSSRFAMHYLHSLAKRLEGSFATIGRGDAKLEGTLGHFELETILQTIVESRATGVLELRDSDGRSFASVFTSDRLVGPVTCGRLRDSEALLEIIVNRPREGSFCFTPLSAARETDQYLSVGPMLLEAARISDELTHLRAEVPPNAALRPLARHLEGRPDRDSELRQEIWELLSAKPVGWEQLHSRLPYSLGRIAVAVRHMLQRNELMADGVTTDWAVEGS